MLVTWIPQFDAPKAVYRKDGDTLLVDGFALDFGPLPDGAVLPAAAIDNPSVVGDVRRIDGVLHISLLLSVAWDAPASARFPEPQSVTVDGLIEQGVGNAD